MDIAQIIRITIRRWYVALTIIAIGALVALTVTSGIKPRYSASIDAFVNAPPSTTTRSAGSLENSGGVGFAGSFEERAMDSDSSRQQIHDKGLLPGYTVKWTRATLVLTIAVTGPVQDQSRRTVEEVVAMANRHLIAHQVTNNVTERAAQFTILPATDGANVSPALYPGRGRQRLMIGAISVIVAVGLSIAVDGLVSGRRGRGPKNQEPGEGSNPVRSAGDFPDYGPTSPGYPAAATRDDVQRENNSSAVINEDTMTINTAGRGGPWSGVPGTDRSGRIR